MKILIKRGKLIEKCNYCGRDFKWVSINCKNESQHKNPDMAERISHEIEKDICDRRGLGDEFECCDDDIQQEIRDEWAQIIRKHLPNAN